MQSFKPNSHARGTRGLLRQSASPRIASIGPKRERNITHDQGGEGRAHPMFAIRRIACRGDTPMMRSLVLFRTRDLGESLPTIASCDVFLFPVSGSLRGSERTPTIQTARGTGAINRPALSGGMDWWRMEWPFPESEKYFSEAEISRKILENFGRKSDFCQISGSEI